MKCTISVEVYGPTGTIEKTVRDLIASLEAVEMVPGSGVYARIEGPADAPARALQLFEHGVKLNKKEAEKDV